MQYYQKDIECMSRNKMNALQLERLKAIVAYTYENVPMYKQKFDAIGLKPSDIQTLNDLQKIPFTVKDDLRDNYPFGLFAAPMKKIVRVHASSGTTGKPTVVGYTKNDLDVWADLIARLVVQAGGSDEDIAQIAFGYGLFTGAFGLHYGLERLGATIVPTSSGNTEKQIMLMKDFGTTLFVATPSYALHISEMMEELGYKRDDFKLRLAMLGSEGHTEEMRAVLEDKLGVLATENYGLSEVMGPGVAGECIHKCGQHIAEDCFIYEIIDPKTGEVLPDGEVGEVVITTINKEGIPVLRYRTKDISYLIDEECKCGRTNRRMAKIQGRTDDMLIIRGVNVFPSQIESVLVGLEHIAPYYQLIVTKKGYTDQLEVQVELDNAELLDSFAQLEAVEKHIQHKLQVVLGLTAKIKLMAPKSIPRTTGKAKHVIDLR
ncbi:MAG: phenylacetate--CoA ligase [Ruminococcaceae bacterium]|nr:phenylacetate--CoA ligase [Oscillospiraceae bacterium]